MLWLRGVLKEGEAAAALAAARTGGIRYNTDPDCDGQPSYEFYPLYRGTWQHRDLEISLRTAVESRLLPHVRQQFDWHSCVACDVILRRCCPGERRGVKVRKDAHSVATAVFPSNPGEYVGGLFAQRAVGADPTQRLRRGPKLTAKRRSQLEEAGLWPLPRRELLEDEGLRPGDALLHVGKLLHGVHVWGCGARYSVIAWFYRSWEECLSAEPLY